MARAEVTGKKPRATAGRAKRSKIPNAASPIFEPDSNAIESTVHGESSSSGCAKATPIRGPPVSPACFSIKTFCLAHHISESMFFKMRAAGLGPQVMQVGNRVLITFESAAAWRREREAATAAAA